MATSERESVSSWRPQYLDGSFAKLYYSYGFEFDKQGSADYHGFGGALEQNGVNLKHAPIYLTYSGWSSISSNSVESVGLAGYIWSSTVYAEVSLSSHQQITLSEIFPAGFGMRWYGESLRCLALEKAFIFLEIASAVANLARLRTLSDLTYMQDMTHDICANTKDRNGNTNITPGNEVTKQLIDVRDGKKYWVSKLADQNCWMVQNLALDIDADKGLSKNDTDITEDWNKDSQYPPVDTITTTQFNVNMGNTAANSWNFGEWVLINPTSTTPCSDISSGGSFTTCNRIETYNSTQDAHYLLGNYYQFNAATAGTGGNNTNSEAAHFTQKLVQQQI